MARRDQDRGVARGAPPCASTATADEPTPSRSNWRGAGYRFLSAFDDADVIAGQGTVGIELAAHAPDVVIVIGGGGLASGVALALKSQGVRVVGAQVEGVDSMARAIRGDVREIAPVSLADGVQ